MARDTRTRAATTRNRVVALVVVVALVAAWWSFLRPVFIADGPVQLILVSGESMEPGLHTGDLAVMYRQDSYGPRDVVAYRSGREAGRPGTTGAGPFVIHRIAGGNGSDGFVMRGDNNPSDDPWEPTQQDVAGRMVLSVPQVGWVVGWLRQPVHIAACLASLFAAMVVLAAPRRREDTDADAGVAAPESEHAA